ncbi:MAG: polysaccharide biosynthesis protein [Bacteroidales bacterium]|nr:polysaccharide biosynthesis protein [Bacteroidales bacterium]
MDEVKTLAKQTVVYGLGTIVPRFLNYGILTFMYTRIFTKAEYGVVTELYAWMVFLLIILTYGMETGFFRFAQKSDDYKKVYSTTLLSLFSTSTLFVLLVFIFIKQISAFMGYSDHPDYIKMFALIVAIDAFTAIPFARLRKEGKALIFSIIKIVNVVITIIAVFFFLFWAKKIYANSTGWFHNVYNPDYGVGYVFLANLIGSISSLIMLLPYIVNVKPVFVKSIWTKMIDYSFPLLISGLAGSINDALDKVLIRRMVGSDQGLATVGEYGAGYKLAVLMSLFIQMYRFAAEPFFFEYAKKVNAKESYALIMKYFILSMLIVYLGINLYISLFQYFIGASFRDSIIVVPIVSMGYLLYGIYVNHSIWYKLNDFTVFGIYITLIGSVVTILVNVLFIPHFGYLASAWAHVFSYVTMLIMSFVFAEKRYKINYDLKRLIPYFILAIGFVIASMLIPYKNMAIELFVNTTFLIIFILYAEKRDKLLTVIFKGN